MPRRACVIAFLFHFSAETVMHRAPVPHPDHEPMEEEDSIPVPGVPAPDDEPVPDHNPQLRVYVQEK
jgi:hypothetical protein